VFIHGAGGDHTIWTRQFEYFRRKAGVYVPELPGHGKSEELEPVSIAEYGEIIKDFVDTLALAPVTLIGHSMGGAITQYMALRYPDRLKSIVLVGTGARLRVTPEILDRVEGHFQEVISTICNYAFGPETPRELVIWVREQMERNRPAVLHRDFVACNQFDSMKEVSRIALPTLILCGKVDLLTPLKYSQYLHDQISGSVLKLIDGSGHMPMLEKPEEFNQELGAFLGLNV
jgi:pimeloyl-ACP methyl ester carboxylesterase